jgi:type IX secretion system PorP/SprF family membrane protein
MVLRKVLITSIVSLVSFCVHGQQDPQFTQNMFNRLFYNPGYAGSNSAICGTALHRQQYTGFKGNPVTTVLSVESNFNVPALYMNNSGIGLTIMSDQIGVENTFAAKLAYSHLIKPNFLPGFFRIGIEGGIQSKSIDGDFIATDPVEFDPAILNTSAMVGDFGFGAYYYSKSMYVGLSSVHLSAPTFTKSSDTKSLNYDLDRHYYATGGYYYDFNTQTPMQLQPSVLVKSSLAVTQVDVNVNFLYNRFVWGGFSLRPETDAMAVAILAGIDFTEQVPDLSGMKFGIAYDLGLSDISKQTGGSFELMLNYCYKIIKPPKRQLYKTIKWL